MLTVNTLKSYTAKDLAQMAKKRGISGWNAMKKDELVKALSRPAKSGAKASAKPASAAKSAKSPSASASAKASPSKRPAAGKAPAGKGVVAKASASAKASSAKPSSAKPLAGSSPVTQLESGKAKAKSGSAKGPGAKPASQAKAPPAKSAPAERNGSVPAEAKRDSAKSLGAKPAAPAANGATASESVKNGEAKPLNGTSAAHRSRGRVPDPPKPKSKGVIRRIQQVHQAREAKMDLATTPMVRNGSTKSSPTEDRIVLLVRDPYWLQASWELTPRCVERAQAALKERWHTARPVLRLLSISNNNVSNNPECVVRIINIHGAVHNWFIDVQDPPHSYRVEIGYLTSDDHFYGLARSNPVTTPRPGSADMMENNWADLIENPEKVFALSGGYDDQHATGELQMLFEERLRRPMGSPMVTRFGNGAEGALNRDRDLQFTIDAEMVVYGVTHPNAYVTMSGEPIKLRDDGTFVARVSLPDRRQVIPIVASSGDGVEERTIVLAIEKNTKVMEPKTREPGE